MNRRLAFVAAAALAIALAACGGGGGGSMPATQPLPVSNNSAIPPQLLVQAYGQGAMTGATYIGPISGAHLNVSVLVHQQNAQGLIAYAQAVQNPASGMFRRFLTPDQIAAQFGAKQSDYQAVAQYFANNGLAVGGWKQRLLLSVSGPQSSMERAFGTTFGLFELNGQKFIAPTSQPHFLQVLAVDAVGGVVRLKTNHSYIITPPRAAAGYTVGYSPSTVRAAFDYQGAYNAGYSGSGITLGIIATGPIDNSCAGVAHGDCDLNAYATQTNSSAANVTQVDVSPNPIATALAKSGCTGSCVFPYSSAFQTPPPVTAPCGGSLPACNPEDGEAQLDTQQAATLAPSANVLFYLAYNAADCTNVAFPNPCPTSAPNYGPEIGISEADAEIMQAINDNQADVISISYGGGEPQQGWTGYSSGTNPYKGSYSQLEFAELASEGVAVFVSSGDDGSAECFSANYLPYQCVSYPSGDPSVTSVGGVTAPLNAYGQATGPWVAWGITTFESGAGNPLGIPAGYGALAGSGGGSSGVGGFAGNPAMDIPAQPWQVSAVNATFREQPDVSMIGDPSTGVSTMENVRLASGALSDIGGTSVAAPQMAAMWADVLSACAQHAGSGMCPASGHRLGNAAPYFYAIYKGTAIAGVTPYLAYNQVFYDIVYGDNQMANPNYAPASPVPGASAGPGYDMVTGVGVPFAGHLIQAITGQQVP